MCSGYALDPSATGGDQFLGDKIVGDAEKGDTQKGIDYKIHVVV